MQANGGSSERDDRGLDGLQRELAEGESKKCVAKHRNGKAAGTDNKVNELMNYGGKGRHTMMVMLYSRIRENEYVVPDRWRGGVLVNLFKKRVRLTRGTKKG